MKGDASAPKDSGALRTQGNPGLTPAVRRSRIHAPAFVANVRAASSNKNWKTRERRMRWRIPVIASALLLVSTAKADVATELSGLVGYKIVEAKTIASWSYAEEQEE